MHNQEDITQENRDENTNPPIRFIEIDYQALIQTIILPNIIGNSDFSASFINRLASSTDTTRVNDILNQHTLSQLESNVVPSYVEESMRMIDRLPYGTNPNAYTLFSQRNIIRSTVIIPTSSGNAEFDARHQPRENIFPQVVEHSELSDVYSNDEYPTDSDEEESNFRPQ